MKSSRDTVVDMIKRKWKINIKQKQSREFMGIGDKKLKTDTIFKGGTF